MEPAPQVRTPHPPGRWDAWRAVVLRLGLLRANLLLTLIVLIGALLVTLAVLHLAGAGSWRLGLIVATTCVLTLSPAIGYVLLSLVYELDASHRRISHLATMDELTGSFNRRHFMELAEREWLRSRRYDIPMALILLDADHFKAVNDTHGHQCGDMLLGEISLACRSSLRGPDVLARFGGEELIVLLPQTDLAGALAMAERMRQRVADLAVAWRGHVLRPTISLGVAELRPDTASIDALVHDADVALYEAKRTGRNRVSTADARAHAAMPAAWRAAG